MYSRFFHILLVSSSFLELRDVKHMGCGAKFIGCRKDKIESFFLDNVSEAKKLQMWEQIIYLVVLTRIV